MKASGCWARRSSVLLARCRTCCMLLSRGVSKGACCLHRLLAHGWGEDGVGKGKGESTAADIDAA